MLIRVYFPVLEQRGNSIGSRDKVMGRNSEHSTAPEYFIEHSGRALLGSLPLITGEDGCAQNELGARIAAAVNPKASSMGSGFVMSPICAGRSFGCDGSKRSYGHRSRPLQSGAPFRARLVMRGLINSRQWEIEPRMDRSACRHGFARPTQ